MLFDANGKPLPGCSLHPGEPTPINARLSMGRQQQPATIIRLVSNKSSSSSGGAAAVGGDKSKFDEKRDIFQTPKLKPFAMTSDQQWRCFGKSHKYNYDGCE